MNYAGYTLSVLGHHAENVFLCGTGILCIAYDTLVGGVRGGGGGGGGGGCA